MKKIINVIIVLFVIISFSSCSSYKYSSAGKAKYTSHKNGKFVKQPKITYSNKEFESASVEVTSVSDETNLGVNSSNAFNSRKSIQRGGWSSLLWLGIILAAILAGLIIFGASTGWIIAVATALGILLIAIAAFVIAAFIVVAFIIAIIEGVF